MVVVRNGKAVRARGSTEAEADDDEDDEEPAAPERFSRTEKKVRALHKILRDIQGLRLSQRDGIELDVQQQAKLRKEPEVIKQIAKLEAVAAKEVAAAAAAAKEAGEDE
eukprot:4810944-Prymnesium_polylepis.1